ncbi:MAG: hypothetical protein A3F69_02545 [Acidobacteria bacterium RIFCSPLOWO2_12_FULL_66_10]|nr:MAG: hypothetical protein A3F69_02545 [Acidobacteria bacterium RIFCSPLOWO2_12_FULL_66_10]
MRAVAVSLVLLAILAPRPAGAQDPPPRIGPFVLDLHATKPRFPNDPLLAASRGLALAELPGSGLGVQVGVHVYPLRWRAVTFGAGGEVTFGQARETPPDGSKNIRATEERFASIAPQISFNFGTGNGWSYISGGIGPSVWSLIPAGQDAHPGDTDRLKTINYGGGARWFMKRHVGFSFDVRLYAINPGTPVVGLLGSPRTTLMVIGAGVSVK